MVICFGWHTNETVCVAVPAVLVALISKLAVPVMSTLMTVTVFPANSNATGLSFCVTVMFCLSVMFSTVAVTAALQFSTVTDEVVGDVCLMGGPFIDWNINRPIILILGAMANSDHLNWWLANEGDRFGYLTGTVFSYDNNISCTCKVGVGNSECLS